MRKDERLSLGGASEAGDGVGIHPCCDGVRVLMATALSTRHVIKQYCPMCGYTILA